MTEIIRNKCELFERNRRAISKKFLFEKSMMSIAAGLIFTGADQEADVEKLTECRSILKKHTGFFSEFRDTIKIILLSEMALSDDAGQYVEDVKTVYSRLRKGHFKKNSHMILAAMLLCDLGRQSDADAVVKKHNEIMKQMEKLHPILTDSEDISYVILLALSDRPVDLILGDMNECFDYLKNVRKIKVGSDSIQRLSEILALTDGDVKEKCDKVIHLYDLLQQSKTATADGYIFSTLGMLTGACEAPESIINGIFEAYEYLKDCKGFDDNADGKKQRLMVAELLIAELYGTGATMVSNAFVGNALSIIKAQQIATMITVISNVLSAVIGVVADNKSTETDGNDTAQKGQ